MDNFTRYWRAYGGWRAFLRSGYFYASVIITILLFPRWLNGDWWTTALSVIPSMLGFSLGGYAVLLAFGSESFQRILAKSTVESAPNTPPQERSVYFRVSANYVHFILMQSAALLVALMADAWAVKSEDPLWSQSNFGYLWVALCALGYWIFCYAILLAVAATMWIFRLSYWFVCAASIDNADDSGSKRKR